MPFTLSHAAAALPFRRTRLILSAVVVGTFAPDLEYFLRFAVRGPFGHTLRGAFLFSLPAALVMLWLFHRFVKAPLVLAFPEGLQRRLAPSLGRFRFLPASRLGLIAVSVLVGIATHILWDSFTHTDSWLYFHWAFLRQAINIPGYGPFLYCRVLQYISTLAGAAILIVWGWRWYKTTAPSGRPPERELTPAGAAILLAVVPVLALLLGVLRVFAGPWLAPAHHSAERALGDAAVTSIAAAWWQLVLCGLVVDRPFFSKSRRPPGKFAVRHSNSSVYEELR